MAGNARMGNLFHVNDFEEGEKEREEEREKGRDGTRLP